MLPPPHSNLFSATHPARLDITEPNPDAGTIGAVAIIEANPGQSSQIRVSAAPNGDMPDSLFLLYRAATGSDVLLARIPFPENSPTVTATTDLLLPPMLAMADSGKIWLAVHKHNSPMLYAEGPVQSILSAVAPEPENEVPPITGSTASGSAYLFITAHGTQDVFNKLQGVVGNLSAGPRQARIWRGLMYENGTPAIMLEQPTPQTIDLELASGSAGGAMSDELVAAIRMINAYINIQTPAAPDGEVRGQLIPARTRLNTPIGAVPSGPSATDGFSAVYDKSGRMIICTTTAVSGNHAISIYAADGRLVHAQSFEGSRCEIPAGGIPAGPYYIRLSNGGNSAAGVCPVMILP